MYSQLQSTMQRKLLKNKPMKTHVLLVSKTFLQGHPKAGEPTEFMESILKEFKIHTLRGNYDYWKKIVDNVNSGKAILSVRCWIGKPYQSKQFAFAEFSQLGIQKCLLLPEQQMVLVEVEMEPGEFGYDQPTYDIEANDGLTEDDFWNWFPKEQEACIIHFTDFRY